LVEKLNRGVMLPSTPSTTTAFLGDGNNDEDADGPHFSRKSRRASLSEIGFGKLETYKKIFDLGEGTYATVFLGQSMLTGKSVALKEIRLEHDEGAPCTA
jgi:cyclin-dependent kinase 17